MAVTDIHSISSTVDLAVDYITDNSKTENGKYVTAYGCPIDGKSVADLFMQVRNNGTNMGNVLAQHLIQSFKPGEVTPELAHQLGIQLAERFLKGRYQYVLATHVDKEHIHNHIIFNNIDMINYLSFNYQENRGKKVYDKLRQTSDELCRENHLSVIENPELGRGKCYYEWMMNKENLSWKTRLKYELDNAIMESNNFEEFLKNAEQKGIEIYYNPEHKIDLKFRMQGQQKWSRAKTLGWYYETPQIKKRIADYQLLTTGQLSYTPKTKIIDTSAEKFQQSKGLERWADIQNMKETSKLLNYLAEQNVSSPEELEEKAISEYGKRMAVVKNLNELQLKIDNCTQLIKELNLFASLKPVGEAYKKSKFKKKFEKENADKLEKLNNVKKVLIQKFPDKVLPLPEKIYDERAELIEKRNEENLKYKAIVARLKEIDKARETVNEYLKQQNKNLQKKNELE